MERTLQILPGAKRPPFPRYHGHAQRRLRVEPLPQRVQLHVSRIVDAVERRRTVQRHEEDVWGWEGNEGVGLVRGRGGELGGLGHCFGCLCLVLVGEVCIVVDGEDAVG